MCFWSFFADFVSLNLGADGRNECEKIEDWSFVCFLFTILQFFNKVELVQLELVLDFSSFYPNPHLPLTFGVLIEELHLKNKSAPWPEALSCKRGGLH